MSNCSRKARMQTWAGAALAAVALSAMGYHRAGGYADFEAERSPKAAPPALTFQVYQDRSRRPGGVVAAAWNDGLVIFALDPDKPGEHLQVGTITLDQLKAVLAELREEGFFEEHTEPPPVPDNARTRISAELEGEAATRRWNEALSRPWGAHAGADPGFRRFAKMWTASRTALAFACPTDYVPLEESEQASQRLKDALNARTIGH